MSSTRSRNKFCLSLENSTSDISGDTAYLSRWSEVVPPDAALTFAALWDPEDGMVTFSGAELLESESFSSIPPHVFDGDDSQFISIDRDTDEVTITGENTATLATFQDAFNTFLQCAPSDSRTVVKVGQDASCCLQTRASSTFDGLDVYSHDIQVKPKRTLRLSCMDLLDVDSLFRTPSDLEGLQLGSNLMLDSGRSDLGSDSCTGGRPAHLKSRFSMTTTSTSNYVDVANSAIQSTTTHICETVLVPERTPPDACVSPAGSWPHLPRQRALLRKRRPWDGDATPTGTRSMPSTPRKATSKPWMPPSPSPASPSPSCPYPSTTVNSPSGSVMGEGRPGRRFSDFVPGAIAPAPAPPTTPTKSPRLKLRFAFLPRWKSRQTSPDSDGWVCIEVTPIIRQRYVADLGED